MPQWRKLHTRITESADFNDMPDDFTRLVWVLLPLGLDREGRSLDNPALIRSRIMPLREDVTLEMIGAALDWFADRGMLVRYEVDGRRYFYVPTFSAYQGNTHKEAPSIYPAPPQEQSADPSHSRPTPDLLQTYSRPTPEQGATNSGTDADADAETDAETDADAPAAPTALDRLVGEERVKRFFSLVEKAGITLNPSSAEQYLAILDETDNPRLIELAFEEAANSAATPNPKWLRKVLDRCKRENCLPGQWRDPPARASPPGDNGTHGVGPSARWG
jgi:hypothetical protein